MELGWKRLPENASGWWTQGKRSLHTGSHLLDHKIMDKAFNHNKIWIKYTQSSKNANRRECVKAGEIQIRLVPNGILSMPMSWVWHIFVTTCIWHGRGYLRYHWRKLSEEYMKILHTLFDILYEPWTIWK